MRANDTQQTRAQQGHSRDECMRAGRLFAKTARPSTPFNSTLGLGIAFRRGLGVLITGRDNYTAVSDQLKMGTDLVDHPEHADDPATAALILAQYLSNNAVAIRSAIKAGNLRHARKLVNGGSHGLNEFVTAFNDGRKFLHLAAIKRAKGKVRKKK